MLNKKGEQKMKKIFTFAIMAVVLIAWNGGVGAYAAPAISFVEPPTPADGATIYDTSAEIEVSITEPALADVTFNWDGTNYSLYDNSLVLMFNFDNVAALGEDYVNGSAVIDVSGSGNNGILSATPGIPQWVAGRYGGAFDFTGDGGTSGQSILVLHNDSLNPASSDFAIAVWILTRDDVDGDILRKGSTNTTDPDAWYKLEHSPSPSNNRLSLNFNTDGTDATVTSAAAYNDYQWHFVVAQRKGNQAELWIDGLLAGTATVTGSISNTANLAVGSKDTQNDDFLNSTVDEVRLYMRSFLQDEIKELYYSNLSKYASDSWTLYVEQSDLVDGTYTYQASASNVGEETASTEQRSVTMVVQGPVTLVPAGAVWKYNDTGTDLHSAGWPIVDDSGWASGQAQLGYGGNGEVTLVNYIDTDPDTGGIQKNSTTYFRHSFNVADSSQVGSLKLRLVRDDGAVVYLNGNEIVRDNMPGGTIYYDTWASAVVGGSDESKWFEFDVDPAGLVDGTNLLAVEIHQISGTSTDISFNLGLAETEHIRKGPYLFYTGVNTEMMVLWQVDVAQGCTLEWGTDPANLSESVTTTEINSDHQHEYIIGGDIEKPPLVPGTKYYYKVTIGAGGAYTGSFTTAPVVNADNLKFLVFGDTRAAAVGQVPYAYDDVCGAMNTFLAANPDYQNLTVHVADWIYNDTEIDWQNMFFNRSLSNALELHANMPINGCIGNHEMNVNGGAVYEKYYPYPYETGGRYWSFDYGPAHFAIVDQYVSYLPGSDQYIWLENDLANSTALWKFIVLHEPGYTAGGGNAGVRNNIHPLCVTYDVDFVLAGHDHYYSRSVVDGVQHITTGGGGAPLKGVNWQSHTVAAESVYEFCEIDIQGDTLYFSALRLDQSVIDSFSITKPWPEASAPSPADEEQNVALDAVLGWTAGVGAVNHDVYFGTSDPPAFVQNQAGTSYGPLSLSSGITYYWRIDEFDGTTTYAGTVWSFTTVDNPQQANDPSPADGQTGIDINPTLTWQAPTTGADSYDVYFGAGYPPASKGNQTATFYDHPETLALNTTYYWRIDSVIDGTTYTGNDWSFTTYLQEPPTKATPTAPTNLDDGTAIDVPDVKVGISLGWLSGERAASHDVYFGVSYDQVNNATNASPEFKGNIPQGDGTYFTWNPTPGLNEDLPYESPYWWRIDEINLGGVTKGAVWNFTTESDTYPPIFTYFPWALDPPVMTAHEATINWTTNELSDSLVDYGLVDGFYTESVYDGNEVTSHSVTLTGLEPGTAYYYMVTSTDHAGNPASEEGQPKPFWTLANTQPVAVDDSTTTNEGVAVVIDVLANDSDEDGDTLTVEPLEPGIDYDPAKATVETDGDTVTYTPLLAAPYIDTFTYTVIDGYGGTDTATVTVDVREPYDDYTADSEIPVFGTVTNSYVDTQSNDAVKEVIEEVLDRPNKNAYSILEHKWLFDVPGSGPLSFHINAYRDGYDSADNFDFAYSTDDLTYTDMLTVTKTDDFDNTYQTYTLPGSISGTVYIRVSDTDSSRKEQVFGQVHVDHMFIRREIIVAPPGQATNPSPANGALDVAVSADLSWTAGTGAESHDVWFGIDPGSLSLVSEGQTETSYDPGTMATTTTYYWRIDEENSFGTTSGEVWSFTTRDSSVAEVYVNDIAMSSKQAGPNYSATATVWVKDETGADVEGATVYGEWSGAVSGAASGVTGLDGQVTLRSANKKNGGTFTFTVTDVAATGCTYNPNHVNALKPPSGTITAP